MSALHDAGVDVVVSMLTSFEEKELELEGEAEAATAVGLDFIAFPTPDRGVPDAEAFGDLLGQLEAALEQGRHVVVHCRMGIGRSSLVAAGLLMFEGMKAPESWDAISAARGMPVPDTPEQRMWLESVVGKR
jgi:protein-tyrosine phosphatase